MPLNERDVTAATAAEVRRAGPITPRALRRAVAARLGLDTKDEAVLFEQYAGILKDAAAASSDAAAGEEKFDAAAGAASDGDNYASYDAVAGEEKFDAIAIEASAAPFEDDSFASARPADERDVAEAMAAFSGEGDYFASASSDADTPARKRETRPARLPSSSADEAERVDKAVDDVANLISSLESRLALQREAGEDEAAASTEAELERCRDRAALLLRRFDELRGRDALEAKLLDGIDRGEALRRLTVIVENLGAQLVAQQEAGDHEAAAATLAEIEEWYRKSDVLLREDGILPRTDGASASSSSYTVGASDASSDDDASTEAGDDSLDAGLEKALAKNAAKIVESESRLASEHAAGDDEAAAKTEYYLNFYKGRHRKLRRIQDSRHETVALRIIVLGEGDGCISALSLVAFLRPLEDVVEYLLNSTPPAKEKLYSTLKKAREMIASRSTEPVTVEMWCDETYLGHAPDLDQWMPLASMTEQVEVWPPKVVDISVALKQVQEAVMAPRCLLAIVDPGIKHVAIPLEGAVLDAPLVNIARYVLTKGDPSEGRERRELGDLLKGELLRTAVVGAAYTKEADDTADGQLVRLDMLKEVREKKFEVPPTKAIHAIDAKLRDAIDATAPFVVLYFSSQREVVEPRVTLSVRDADSAPTMLADVVLRMDYFPKSLCEVVGAVVNITKRNATIPSKIEEEVGKALIAFVLEPKYSAVILVAVNGEKPRKMSFSCVDEKIDAPPGKAVARVAIDVVVAALPAPGTRTLAQRFWLESRAARLADECVAALVAGEPMPRDHIKKLHVMKDLGDDRVREDLNWIQFVGQLRAKRTAKKMKEMDAQRKDMFDRLSRIRLSTICVTSAACRRFLDEHYPALDARARADALQMLVLKRFSLEASSGRGLKDHVHDLVTYVMEGPSDEASYHPHVLAARLVFSYWIASGEPHRTEEGEPYRRVKFRGEPAVCYETFLNEAGRRDIVALVLRADDYTCADYDADGLRRARHTLADAAFLWTKRFDAAATQRYEVAAAAGNVLAGEIVKRLHSTDTATLSRKYKLDAFATRHLETLPPGLSGVGAVFDLASKNDAARAPTPRADTAAAAAAATESFAVDSAAAKTGKKKQQKAKKLREEKERKAKKKLEDERRRREAAAREEAERPAREAAARAAHEAAEAAEAAEVAAREEAKREAAKREAAARAADETDEPSEEASADEAPPAEETAPDDGDWTGVRSRRERRAAAEFEAAVAAADEEARAAAAARDDEAASLALARQLSAEDTAAPPLAPASPPRRRVDEFIASTGVAGAAADKLRSLAPDHQARLVRRLEISVAAGASAVDLEVVIMRADDQQYTATASELAALDPSLRPVADRLALTSAAVWSLSTLDSLQQEDLAYRFAEPGLLDDIVDLDDFIARAFAREKTCDILLRESVSFMEPDLVNAIHGLSVDLSRSCVKELRALDEPTQRNLARALATLDFRDIRDPSAYILRGLERGSLLGRVAAPPARPPPSPVAPPRSPVAPPLPPVAPPPVALPPPAAPWAAPTAPTAPAWGGSLATAWNPAPPPPPVAPAWVAIEPPASAPPPPPAAPAWSPIEPAPPPAAPVPAWGAVAPPPPPPPAAWSTPDAAPLRPAPVDSDDDFVVPEGLVDVERRSNCSLDAIVAVLSQCPTFRRALGNGAEAEAAQSDALRYLGAAFRASAGGTDAEVDAAVDGLRAALAARGNDEDGEGVRSELATGGAHLDVAEVLGEVVAVLGTAKRCRGAALALRTRGHIHQQACRKCGHRNADFRDDVAFDELARSAPAAALVHAALGGAGRLANVSGCVANVFRDAHAHAAKSCDACHAPAACEVDVVLDQPAKVLVLSLAWYSTDQQGGDVASLLELVWRDAPMAARKAFTKKDASGRAKHRQPRKLDLFAVAVYQNAHYTAFVRARDGSDSWTHHDRRSAVAVGAFANVVQRCRDGPMLPYLLFYDSLAGH